MDPTDSIVRSASVTWPVARSRTAVFVPLVAMFVALLAAADRTRADEAAEVEKRLAATVRCLASDDLQGRAAGSKGLESAADHIAAQFAQVGLKTSLFGGAPHQRFPLTTAVKLGSVNRLHFVSPGKESDKTEMLELRLGSDFTPLAIGASGTVDLPVVFVGYGITGAVEKYDDYAGVDAAGKAVVILRHEPQQDDPKSVFDGVHPSPHSFFRRKLANAIEHRAAAVIFCQDDSEGRAAPAEDRPTWPAALDKLASENPALKKAVAPVLEETKRQQQRIGQIAGQISRWGRQLWPSRDPMVRFDVAGRQAPRPTIPVVACRRSVIDRVMRAALGANLAALAQRIDAGPAPQSRALGRWRVRGEVQVERTEVEARNVVAVCEAQGPLANESVVIGAHYDHIGMRKAGSPSEAQVVCNGADDNASGVAVMLEVARAIAARQEKPRRRVVFVAFAGEEVGLAGSHHYVTHAPFPLDKTVAMLNLDMVGRLRDEKLTVGGVGTAARFGDLLDQANRSHRFQLAKSPAGFGPSDQLTFHARRVPVMHFFTGLHEDYHKPTDDPEKLNLPGMRRIAEIVGEITVALANGEDRPQFVWAEAPVAEPGSRGGRPQAALPAWMPDQR